MSGDDGDGFTSLDRNMLRGVRAYEDRPATVSDIVAATGYTKSTVRSSVRLLEAAGLLERRRGEMSYTVTAIGLAELAVNQYALLLVEVDDRVVEDTCAYLVRASGVKNVHEHGPGCCCKNCPWGGNHG